ncbi:TetR/AcrR family transcriptional regulator [Microbacterium sp. A8/3-1]|uniref:TetR/AcrR family transcriptional regulator n=1 Tax=Microbacterium sp. A8/3-1 TaxID=3160749 RepID=A0AAU7W453_9MICO
MKNSSRVAEPQQDRSRESLERVMEAGLEVLAEGGWQEFTIARVCERAGVSVGMIYRRFHGREDLLIALQDRWLESAAAGVAALLSDEPVWARLGPRDALHRAIMAFIEVMRGEEDRTRVLGAQSALDSEMLARLARISHAYSDWFRTVMLRFSDAMPHDDPTAAADFTFRMVFDMTIRRITHGDDYATGSSVGDWDRFGERLTDVGTSYLFPAQAADDPIVARKR